MSSLPNQDNCIEYADKVKLNYSGNLKDEMESPESSPDCRLVKFYSSDVHDEVDLHFAKALSTAATKSHSPEGSPKSEGKPRSTPTTTAPLRIHSIATTAPPLPPPPTTVNIHHWQHHLHTPFPTHSSETHSLHSMLHSKGRIIHPQFVGFVIHPEVDPYKDIPKLPGQSDPSFSPPPHIGWISCEDLDRGSQEVGGPTLMDLSLTEEELKHILEET